MKLIKIECFSFLIFSIIGIFNVNGQDNHFLTIDNNTIQIQNVQFIDSLIGNTGIIKIVKFEFALVGKDQSGPMLTKLYESVSANKMLTALFGRCGDNMISKNDQSYNRSVVEELVLPTLQDGINSNKQFMFKVKIAASSVTVPALVDRKIVCPKDEGKLTVSDFKLTLGNLPTANVKMISGITFRRSTAQGSKSYGFSVDLAENDQPKWNDFYANRAGRIMQDGKIELIDKTGGKTISTINLSGIKIDSYKTNPGNSNTVNYGLLVGNVKLN